MPAPAASDEHVHSSRYFNSVKDQEAIGGVRPLRTAPSAKRTTSRNGDAKTCTFTGALPFWVKRRTKMWHQLYFMKTREFLAFCPCRMLALYPLGRVSCTRGDPPHLGLLHSPQLKGER